MLDDGCHAVTYGPGLVGASHWDFGSKGLALARKPLIAVNHVVDMTSVNFSSCGTFRLSTHACACASGGHTELVYMQEDMASSKLSRNKRRCRKRTIRLVVFLELAISRGL